MSPLVKWTFVALGGAVVVHWAVKEVRRVNEELDARRRVSAQIPRPENGGRRLRRDPAPGNIGSVRSCSGLIELSGRRRGRWPPIMAPKNSTTRTHPMN